MKAARWHLQGRMEREVGLNARDLFTGATNEKIFLVIDDLTVFNFTSPEGGENVSAWLDANSLEVRWTENGVKMDREVVTERGLDKFSVRACIQPESVGGALLWITAVPLSKQELIEKRPRDYMLRKCPQIAYLLQYLVQ